MPNVSLVTLKLVSLSRCFKSPIAEVLTTKPRHKIKKPSAAFDFKKKVIRNGLKTSTAKAISGMRLFYH